MTDQMAFMTVVIAVWMAFHTVSMTVLMRLIFVVTSL